MPAGYTDVWRSVRLHASAAPTFLVREWVNNAWKTLARARSWSFLRAETALTINASRSVAVTVTRGSATVTSAALFLAADDTRQLTIAGLPTYTIVAFGSTSSITLDRVYGETSGAATATIFDGYATLPADFGSFRLIADPYTQRRLAFWIHEDQLNLLDPARTSSDSGPRVLVARAFSTHPSTLGRVQYEYWPRPTADRSYPALYNRQADAWIDGESFTGVLADAGDVVQTGALAQAALWPGTSDRANPYFNLGLATQLRTDFADGIQRLSLLDDTQYPDDLQRVDWARWPLADLAYDDASLRSSDATIADLY